MTIEKIEQIWADFKQKADRAEQYQFPRIMYWQLKLEPLYKDLKENWNEDHANIFMRLLRFAYKDIGWSVSEVENEESN